MEVNAGLIGDNTVRLDKMLSWKYAHMSGDSVVNDMKTNHLVRLSKGFVQNSVRKTGEFFSEEELEMSYELPMEMGEVDHISLSRDGASMPVCPSGWRESLCGSISFHNRVGERLHTIYVACSPEYGGETFRYLFDSEVKKVKDKFPNCTYIGIADGAKCNWTHLSKHTKIEILDFYHASEYLSKAAKILYCKDKSKQEIWLKDACHRLKNKPNAVKKIIHELKKFNNQLENENIKIELGAIITYFTNHLDQMNYPIFIQKGYPIGSGVIEAACKTVVKHRFSASGMKWNIQIANGLLLLRTLVLTNGRWEQAWNRFRKNAA
jgi:hypothetical protein